MLGVGERFKTFGLLSLVTVIVSAIVSPALHLMMGDELDGGGWNVVLGPGTVCWCVLFQGAGVAYDMPRICEKEAIVVPEMIPI